MVVKFMGVRPKKYKPGAVVVKKKNIVAVNVIITETMHNVFLTIASLDGKVVAKASSGQMKLQKRNAPLSVELLGMFIGKQLEDRGFFSYGLHVVGAVSKLVKSAIRGLQKYQVNCTRLIFLEVITHNGVRLRVPKRK